ncbi:MAG TPA: DinB family protein [Chitinophagaceae bacterium]|nr:DinB family protein [Chitinophagaceae bacterium]HQZ73934.1 DinB family protein [Chitinophagaceae bacterium]
MNKETQSIIRRIENVNSGEPWFGRAVFVILEEVDAKKVSIKPNCTEHSMLELLYHMITWADFTLKRLEKNNKMDMAAFEKMDWRELNPKLHSWKKALAEFKAINKKIIALLDKKDDDFLLEIVDYRKYNYRFLLNGMIEHSIYHLGQVAYLNKMLS